MAPDPCPVITALHLPRFLGCQVDLYPRVALDHAREPRRKGDKGNPLLGDDRSLEDCVSLTPADTQPTKVPGEVM